MFAIHFKTGDVTGDGFQNFPSLKWEIQLVKTFRFRIGGLTAFFLAR